ncbi:MAG TPA: hypothetical protein VJL29_00500, partial [Thermoguttaceae bacterium]|nr:hypothetical protein [Thermoguttaceae bacterium]
MFDVSTLLVLIPALPLAAAVLTAALGARWLGPRAHWPTVCAIGLSLVASLALVAQVAWESSVERPGEIGYERTVTLWHWASVETAPDAAADSSAGASAVQPRNFTIDVTLRADPLTAIMLATVTLVSLLVAIYSIGYMHDDRGYWRFFSYISLFVFSMTMLVSVSNFVLLYVFWEAVGLCSYLLI